jgi:hypothetical protein
VTLAGPFTVTDNKISITCPGTPVSLAPGASLTCTASYTIKQSDLDAGLITNIATAAATFHGNPVISLPDTATVNANQSPDLELMKSASPGTYDTVGQSISYSYG